MQFTVGVGAQIYPPGVSALAPKDRARIKHLGASLYWVDVPRRTQVYTGVPRPDDILPVISLSGATFSLDYAGSWQGDIATYQFQWTRNGTNIGGDTAVTRAKIGADDGTTIACKVLATDKLGRQSTTAMASNGIAMPAVATIPGNTRVPRILLATSVVPGATVAVGTALIADVGDWTGSPTYSVTWFNPPAGGGTPANRGTFTVAPYGYTTQTLDQNETVYFTVTATNGSGSATPLTAASQSVVPAGAAGGGGGGTLTLRASVEYDIAGAGGPTTMSEQLPDRVPLSTDWAKWPR